MKQIHFQKSLAHYGLDVSMESLVFLEFLTDVCPTGEVGEIVFFHIDWLQNMPIYEHLGDTLIHKMLFQLMEVDILKKYSHHIIDGYAVSILYPTNFFNEMRWQASYQKPINTIAREYVANLPSTTKKKEQEKKELLRQDLDDCGVYIIKSGEFCKIGKSIHIDQRVIKQISPKLPEEPVFIRKYLTAKHTTFEAMLHKRFGDLRTNGEWFSLNEEHISAADAMAIDYEAKIVTPENETPDGTQ